MRPAARIALLLSGMLACGAEEPGPVPRVSFERAWPKLRFRRPVFLAEAPGDPDRRFVVEQDGRVMVFPAGEDAAGELFAVSLDEPIWRVRPEEARP